MSRTFPIGEHGFVGDTRSGALVAPDGAVDWLCLPRFDSPPLFGRLIGGEDAGTWEVGSARGGQVTERRYRGATATLETTWQTDAGRLVLADGMVSDVEGRLLPGTVLVRMVQAPDGPVAVRCRFAPRFGWRRTRPSAGVRGGGLVCAHGPLAVALTSDVEEVLALDEEVEVVVTPDRPLTLVLTASLHGPVVLVPPSAAREELARDERGWEDWAATIRQDLPGREAALRSLVTLRLLTYSPSGAPVAAPTTSLPEEPGGVRNWDYRYAWPRDASLAVGAFLGVGQDVEARGFLAWLLHASRLERPRLPVLLNVDGGNGPRERELEDWPGWAGSRPVRVGNAAAAQHQLDGYGWVVDAAWLLEKGGHTLYPETWRAVAAFADHVAEVWTAPDAGIWERRDEARHHVHSKLMAWLALDRAIRLAGARKMRAARVARWERARQALGAQVQEQGFDPVRGTYTGWYGGKELDAAVLVLPLVGLEPPTSPRVTGTIDAIRTDLSAGGPLLYRYWPGDDGLPGREGAFLPCSFWLVQALALNGRRAEAEALLAELLPLGGPLGLFAEECDPATGAMLGNYPQALTHSALVQAVLALVEEPSASPPAPLPSG